MHGINEFEVKEVRKMMKSSKDVGPYGIFIELWRYLWEMGVKWLSGFFNKIEY